MFVSSLTMAVIEESESSAVIEGPTLHPGEALHVLIIAYGLLNGRVLSRQPAPLTHAAVQPCVHLHLNKKHTHTHTQEMGDLTHYTFKQQSYRHQSSSKIY